MSTPPKRMPSPEMDLEDYVKRLQEFMGPDCWQEHKPATAEPSPEPATNPTKLADVSPDQSPVEKDIEKDDMESSWSWAGTGHTKGEPSREGTLFCPWKMVKNYPEMFIGKTNKQRAKRFFDNPAIHKHNPWDFYYLYNPTDTKGRYILFVPTYQFENMLHVVNNKLGTLLTIPNQRKNANKFEIVFGMGDSPMPRFLGRSTSYEEFEALERSVPPYNNADQISKLSVMAQEDFLNLLKNIESISSTNGTKSKKSEKKRIQRIQDRKSWGKSIKRVQRYLGLRLKASELPSLDKLTTGDAKALHNANAAHDAKASASTSTVQVVSPPERGVIFVAIDIEAFEFSHALITEIGVAIFDTLDINNRPPGDKGKDWFSLIHGYHYRIKENSWAQNRVHVDGNEDKFDFGTTEFIEQARIRKLVENVIENPASLTSKEKENKAKPNNRPVVLVFHNAEADIKFLEALKYDVTEAKNVLEVVDTSDMYQHGAKADQAAGLERVLVELNIPSRYLHNAGNDAVYTMQVLIGLAFKLRQQSLERAIARKANGATAGKEKDGQGWGTGGDESDGGKPGEKAAPMPFAGMNYLRGKAFQPGQDVPRPRAPSPPRDNVFSWSDSENDMADADHLRW